MGYDMTIVQDRDQDEKDAIAAAQAHLNSLPRAWQMPEGPERDAATRAADEAYNACHKADRSYFRLNIFGMGRCCNAMAALDMLTFEDRPDFPRPEDHGLTEWPDRDDDNLTDAERAFLAAGDAVRDYEPQPVKGIPEGKFSTNDGWLVTPAQCSAAVATYRAQPEAVQTAAEAEFPWWADWIAFLDYASGHGGFRVY